MYIMLEKVGILAAACRHFKWPYGRKITKTSPCRLNGKCNFLVAVDFFPGMTYIHTHLYLISNKK